MANLNIAIKIAAEDKASGPIGRIKNALGDLSGSATKGFSGLQSVAKVAGGALVGAVGLAAGAVAGIGVAAFQVGDDMDVATANIQAALGATTEEAERLGDVALAVWKDNFAGSIPEAADAIALVRQQLGDLTDDELEETTKNAFKLSDSFGIDVAESVNAVNTLMGDFGMTSEQAFDFIASGFQKGLNRSDDFLDTIGEYSTQFANGGADAAQFFSLLESGVQGGMLGTDKAADAFKEFRVRIQDGSKATKESLAMIGISSEELAAQMADGSVSAADAFTMVVDALRDVDDENIRMQAGVGLLGTQFEDLGTEGALALSLVGSSMEDIAGATDTLDAKYNNLGDVVEGFRRRGLSALEPIGGMLLDLANRTLPIVEQAFDFFETAVVPAIEMAADAFGSFVDNLQEGMNPLNAFIEAIWDIAPPEVLNFLVALRDDILPGLSNWFAANVQPIIAMVAEFVSWQDVLAALGVVVASIVLPALASIVVAVAPVIAVGAALIGAIALVRNAWENDWGGIRTSILAAWEGSIKPALETLWVWLNENIPVAIAWLKDKFNEYWPIISAAIGTAWNTISGIFSALTGWLSSDGPSAIAPFVDFVKEQFGVVVGWFEENWPLIQETVSAVMGAIRSVVETVVGWLVSFWEQHGATIMNSAALIWDTIKTIVGTAIQNVLDVIKLVMQLITGDWEGAWETIRGAVERNLETILRVVGNITQIAKNTLSVWLTEVKELFSSVWQNIVNAVSGKMDEMKASITNKIDAIKAFLAELPSAFASLGRNAIQGFIDGAGQLAQSLISSVTGPVQSAIDAAKGLLGIHSPSQVFVDMARQMGAGLEIGAGSALPAAQAAIQSLVQPPAFPIPALAGAGAAPGAGGPQFTINVYANDEAGGRRAGRAVVGELRSRGIL